MRKISFRNFKNNRILQLGIAVIILLILIIGIKYMLYLSSDEYKFKKIGYSKNEINIILDKIKEKDITTFLKQDYNSNLAPLLDEKYFIYDNLDRYLTYAKENTDKSSTDVISVVNAGSDYAFYTNISKTDMSKDNLIIVNKHYQLDKDFVPTDLVQVKNWYAYGNNELKQEVYDSFLTMYNDANRDGLKLIITSGYRSYQSQADIYNDYVNSNGKTWADSVAARPGHSEHQTGLTFDLITSQISDINDFENTDEFAWMQANAHKYGFILRYPKGKEYITGYNYESWHYRYVSEEVATKIYNLGITFDEYYEYYIK